MTNDKLSDGRTVGTTITSLVCKHMPSAAVASGLVSPVNFTGTLVRLWVNYGEAIIRQENLGLSAVRAFLTVRGEQVGESVVRAWRLEVLAEVLRRESVRVLWHLPS